MYTLEKIIVDSNKNKMDIEINYDNEKIHMYFEGQIPWGSQGNEIFELLTSYVSSFLVNMEDFKTIKIDATKLQYEWGNGAYSFLLSFLQTERKVSLEIMNDDVKAWKPILSEINSGNKNIIDLVAR